MSCTVCGSDASCGCRSRVVAGSTCLCVTPCSTDRGYCQNCVSSSPTPYYACGNASPQSHSQKIVVQQFYADVSVASSWNVPICGGQATVTIPGLKSINPGSYLWDATYGYFEVISFDAATETVVLQNNCNDGNAAPGTNVPACTLFTITDPPPPNANASGNCVEIDFTAPDVDDCIDITLNSTSGIASGDTVGIGTGFYFVSDVKPNNIITICNQGEGIVAGTPVIAKDAAGNYNYCLDIISTNNCERDPVDLGSVLVCSEIINQPLQSVLEVTDSPLVQAVILTGTDRVEAAYEPLDTSIRACTFLNVAWTIASGDPTYTLDVDDPTIFISGDKLEVPGVSATILVTAVGVSTIDVTLTPTPGANDSIAVDTWICKILCCEDLTLQISEINEMTFMDSDSLFGFEFPLDARTVSNNIAIGPTLLTMPTNLTWNITNPSATRNLKIQMHFRGDVACDYATLDIGGGSIGGEFRLIISKNGIPIDIPFIQSCYVVDSIGLTQQSIAINFAQTNVLGVGATDVYVLESTLTFVSGPPDSSIAVANYRIAVDYTTLPE